MCINKIGEHRTLQLAQRAYRQFVHVIGGHGDWIIYILYIAQYVKTILVPLADDTENRQGRLRVI